MRNNRRGAALPGAIILCSLIVVVSIGLSTVFISLTASNFVSKTKNANSLSFAQAFNNFKDNDGAVPESSRYTWKVYETTKDGDTYKALCAKDSNNNLIFYGIYNFTDHETIAYQESNFYITNEGGTDYLAGIVPMVEEE